MTNELHKQFDNQHTIVKVLIDDVTDYATLITYLDWQGYNWRNEEVDFGEDINLHLDFFDEVQGYIESGEFENMAVFIDILTHKFSIGQYETPKVDVVAQFYGEEQEGTVYSFKTFDAFLEKYILIGSDDDLDELAERTAERLVNEVADYYLFDEDDEEYFVSVLLGDEGSYSSIKTNKDGMTLSVSKGKDITINGEDEEQAEDKPDNREASEQIQYQSVPSSYSLYSQTLDALKDKESQELVVFTNNGQTYLFSNVTNFTTTTTGFKFTYEGKMTGETREATFNNTSVAGFALK